MDKSFEKDKTIPLNNNLDYKYHSALLFSIMAFPEDKKKQLDLGMAITMERLKNRNLETRIRLLFENPSLCRVLAQSIDQFWEKSPSKIIKEGALAYKKCLAAGEILLTALSLGLHHDGFSLSKAKFLLGKTFSKRVWNGEKILESSPRKLDQYWNEYKNVAHMAAAMLITCVRPILSEQIKDFSNIDKIGFTEIRKFAFQSTDGKNVGPLMHFEYFTSEGLRLFVSTSETIREFAMETAPNSCLVPYLNESAWKIKWPGQEIVAIDVKKAISPLSQKHVDLVKDNYKAKTKNEREEDYEDDRRIKKRKK